MSISFSVNNNASASNILSNLNNVQNEMNTSYQQLSSGNRVNSAANDPAGYAISQQMQQEINGLNQATQNAQNGISLIQTGTGAMNQVESILQTMNTLATEAANGTQNTTDQSNLNKELTALTSQITSINNDTTFNNTSLFGTGTISLQVGSQASQTLGVSFKSLSLSSLGISTLNIGSTTGAQAAMTAIQGAIKTLSGDQANAGAVQDRLNYTVSNLQNASENLQNAKATITNTNMAKEYTQFSQQQVLQQVGLSMLGHAQQQPSAILKLLQ